MEAPNADIKVGNASSPGINYESTVIAQYTPKKYAFVTVACHQSLVDPVSVLAASWASKAAATSQPRNDSSDVISFVVLVAPNLVKKFKALNEFLEYSLVIVELNERKAEFAEQTADVANQCEFAMIQAWGMTQYDKMLFIDPNSVFMGFENDWNSVFRLPQGSAAISFEAGVNKHLFVLAPNKDMYDYMASANRPNTSKLNPIDKILSNQEYIPKTFGASVMHYHSTLSSLVYFNTESKPWNWMVAQSPGWRSEVDGNVFYEWTVYWHHIRSMHRNISESNFTSTNLLNGLYIKKTDNWNNEKRTESICNSFRQVSVNSFSITDKTSAVLSTYKRINVLIEHAKYLITLPNVIDAVFVVWHNLQLEIPAELMNITAQVIYSHTVVDMEKMKVGNNVPIFVVKQTFDSLNNRFNPIKAVRTSSVLTMDDDIHVPERLIDTGLKAWRSSPDSIVGYFPRVHVNTETSWQYRNNDPTKPNPSYSMVLTKAMIHDTFFMYAYTCLMPARVHAYIDNLMNCEDIAMNMMVSGITGKPPLLINNPLQKQHALSENDYIIDHGSSDGISNKKEHYQKRDNCLADLSELLGKMTLVPTSIQMTWYNDHTAFKQIKS